MARTKEYENRYKDKRLHGISSILKRKKIGWGGRIRTFTVLINSEVSYRLDHAPAVTRSTSQDVERKKITLTARSG
jgi:hypothetical protein